MVPAWISMINKGGHNRRANEGDEDYDRHQQTQPKTILGSDVAGRSDPRWAKGDFWECKICKPVVSFAKKGILMRHRKKFHGMTDEVANIPIQKPGKKTAMRVEAQSSNVGLGEEVNGNEGVLEEVIRSRECEEVSQAIVSATIARTRSHTKFHQRNKDQERRKEAPKPGLGAEQTEETGIAHGNEKLKVSFPPKDRTKGEDFSVIEDSQAEAIRREEVQQVQAFAQEETQGRGAGNIPNFASVKDVEMLETEITRLETEKEILQRQKSRLEVSLTQALKSKEYFQINSSKVIARQSEKLVALEHQRDTFKNGYESLKELLSVSAHPHSRTAATEEIFS